MNRASNTGLMTIRLTRDNRFPAAGVEVQLTDGNKIYNTVTDQNGREPSIDEIAQALDLPPAQITAALDAITAPVSLYEPVYSEGGDAICVMDQVSDTKNTDERWTERIALKDAMKLLDPRERRILSLRFYEGKTQMEVSAEVGISQAQVSRLEKGAINTIRKHL